MSNKAQFRGDFLRGEEGAENDDLIRKGSIGPDGKITSGLPPTCDRFRQEDVRRSPRIRTTADALIRVFDSAAASL